MNKGFEKIVIDSSKLKILTDFSIFHTIGDSFTYNNATMRSTKSS